jgi:DUF4097 and DUF4098 domain-containing protein YvlB
VKILIFIFSIPVFLYPQQIFESFDYDSKHSFVGTNKYEFTVDEDGKENRTLVIKDIFGDITIEGQETYKVNIMEEIKVRSSSERRAKKYYDESRTEIKKSSNGNIIEIKGSTKHKESVSYKFNIIVPVEFSIKTMITGGDIDISTISGVIKVTTSGGDIKLNGISGKIDAKTAGGDVEVRNSEGNVNLSTSGGDIEVLYTDGQITVLTKGGDINIRYVEGSNVNVKTSGGSIEFSNVYGQNIVGVTSGGDIEVEDVRGNMELRTSGGDLILEDLDGNLIGKTLGGDIELESVNGNIDISTSVGSIEGEDLNGSIKAETGSGDIKIVKIWNQSLKNHTINLETGNGSIGLILPNEFPSTINAIIHGSNTGHNIESEFPITLTSKNNEVHGFLVNGKGTFPIQLKTSHGDITLEKE